MPSTTSPLSVRDSPAGYRAGEGADADAAASVYVDIGNGIDGHRGHYGALLPPLIHARRAHLDRRTVMAREPILISMVEESFFRYVLTCLLRSGMGRVTAGLLFRPLPPLREKGFRLAVKRWCLMLLRALPRVRTMTILPFSLEPDFDRIAASWIHDPQFWDLHLPGCPGQEAPAHAEGMLAAQIRAAAAGRKICCAMGRQDSDKGFDQFARLWLDNPALRQDMLFVFGGKVTPSLSALAQDFADAGGLAFNRFITDEELFDLYAAADVVWACYAPRYDQASGIFGRAMQMGLPVFVRSQSLIHRSCINLGVPHRAIDEGTTASDLGTLPPREAPDHAARRGQAMARESMGRLRAALGLAA